MKNKVIIFTDNNARILVNPAEVEIFEDKPNAYVNPDLRFVTGVAPHHWKQLNSDKIKIDDAIKIQQSIGDSVDWTQEHDSFENQFYKKLFEVLEKEVVSTRKASQLMVKLLNMVDGLKKEEITKQLKESFIKKSTNPVGIKENQVFMALINKWEHGLIVPMTEDERKIRDEHIKRIGSVNILNKIKQKLQFKWLFWAPPATAILIWLLLHKLG